MSAKVEGFFPQQIGHRWFQSNERNIRKTPSQHCLSSIPFLSHLSMASLQISGGSVRFVAGFNRTGCIRPICSLGFPRSRRRISIGRPLLLRCSTLSGESETDEITDSDRDGSGASSASLLGFQLAPPGTTFVFYFIL